jgi:hypothetical protein
MGGGGICQPPLSAADLNKISLFRRPLYLNQKQPDNLL